MKSVYRATVQACLTLTVLGVLSTGVSGAGPNGDKTPTIAPSGNPDWTTLPATPAAVSFKRMYELLRGPGNADLYARFLEEYSTDSLRNDYGVDGLSDEIAGMRENAKYWEFQNWQPSEHKLVGVFRHKVTEQTIEFGVEVEAKQPHRISYYRASAKRTPPADLAKLPRLSKALLCITTFWTFLYETSAQSPAASPN